MRHILLGITVAVIFATSGFQNALAQQRQIPPETTTYRSTSVQRTQWSPDSANAKPDSTVAQPNANGSATAGTKPPGLLPAATPQSAATLNSQFATAAGRPSGNMGPLLTNQQLQNPSGGYHLTHSGFTTNSYVSPNNYFGSQYNNWSNLRNQPSQLSTFESFNRTQPPTNTGAYFSVNNYTGPANNQWNNLSSGSAVTNAFGGWIYQP